jgi:hypothetical protein
MSDITSTVNSRAAGDADWAAIAVNLPVKPHSLSAIDDHPALQARQRYQSLRAARCVDVLRTFDWYL